MKKLLIICAFTVLTNLSIGQGVAFLDCGKDITWRTALAASDLNTSHAYYLFEFSTDNFLNDVALTSMVVLKNQGPGLITVPLLQYKKVYQVRIRTRESANENWSSPGPICTFEIKNTLGFLYCDKDINLYQYGLTVAQELNYSHAEYLWEVSKTNFDVNQPNPVLYSQIRYKNDAAAIISAFPQLEYGPLEKEPYQIRVRVKLNTGDLDWSGPGPSCAFNIVNSVKFNYCGQILNPNTAAIVGTDLNASHFKYLFEFSDNNFTGINPILCTYELSKSGGPALFAAPCIKYGQQYWVRVRVKAHSYSPEFSQPGPACSFTTIACPAGTIALTVSKTDEICTSANGTATVNATGGVQPYNFSWDNGATTKAITNLSAGTYNAMVTDNKGCQSIKSVEISKQALTYPLAFSSTDEGCGSGNGTATVNASGGSEPYGYNWSNGGITTTITGLSAGIYNVSVTDNRGCVATGSTEVINQNNPPVQGISLTQVYVEICADGVGEYTWSNGNTSKCIMVVADGSSHSVSVNNNGCITTTCTLVPELKDKKLKGCQERKKITGITESTGTGATGQQGMIFPNPNNGKMVIEYPLMEENASLMIIDISGKLHYTSTLPEGSNMIRIEETNLTPGIYLYKIITDSNVNLMQGEFIINK